MHGDATSSLVQPPVCSTEPYHPARLLAQGLAWLLPPPANPQLSALQEQLARMDYLPGMIRAFEGERACGIAAMEHWMRSGAISGQLESEDLRRTHVQILACLPRGLIRQNEISLAQYHTEFVSQLRTAVSNGSQTGLAAAIQDVTG